MQIASALSGHPLATQAVGEVVGEVLEHLDGVPDVAMLFVTTPHVGALEDVARAVRKLLNPRVLVGATAGSVLGGGREVEDAPGIVLWAARLDADVEPVRLDAIPTADALVVAGGGVLREDNGTLILVGDPFTFPMEQVLAHLGTVASGVAVVGGLASAARGPGGNRLVLDAELFRDGAVGVWLPPEVPLRVAVSQGCRPVGRPWTVTRAEGTVLYELAGAPAVDRLNELIESLDDEEKTLLAGGLLIGRAIDEHRFEHGTGDFLVRSVLGADRGIGALQVGLEVPVGATVQFQVRDAASAEDDLHRLAEASAADGALMFTCNGRGSHLFGEAGREVTVLREGIGGGAVAGMFCAGEVGPVGTTNHVHSMSAAIAFFGPGSEA
ncbi:MAG: FIST N-terminal domain-containing protein [Microthrixaceae bacterium]